MPENKLMKRVQHILSPLQGEEMAAATVRIHCAVMGRKPEDLSPADLPVLVKSIQESLIIFLGSDKAQAIARSIEMHAV